MPARGLKAEAQDEPTAAADASPAAGTEADIDEPRAAAATVAAAPAADADGALRSTISPGLRFCKENPFLAASGITEDAVASAERRWEQWRRGQLGRMVTRLTDYHYSPDIHPEDPRLEDANHLLYKSRLGDMIVDMMWPEEQLLQCSGASRVQYGKGQSERKSLCGLQALSSRARGGDPRGSECVVYSLGSNGQFEFEADITARTDCHVFVFDCTSEPPARLVDRIHFEKACVGQQDAQNRNLQVRMFPYAKMPSGWGGADNGATLAKVLGSVRMQRYGDLMEKLGHERVHVLKMDIEGAEYAVFADLLRPEALRRAPFQISFESHWWHRSIGHAMLTEQMFEQLWRSGYRMVSLDKQMDSSCVEWTAMRVFC
jgi:FkbM family methyltransferase